MLSWHALIIFRTFIIETKLDFVSFNDKNLQRRRKFVTERDFPILYWSGLMSESCATIKLAVLIERAIGGLGQRNREEIGAEATKTPPASFELAFAYGIVPIGSECSPVNQIFGCLPWESSN